MEPSENYTTLVNTIHSSLKKQHFTKSRNRFYLQSEETWGVVDLQKSSKSNLNSIVFTVNLGIASKRLLRRFSTPQGNRPDIWACQWQVRLGHLLGTDKDVWWKIDSLTSIDSLSQVILQYILNYGIPEMLKYMSDKSLRDLWLSKKAPSLTEIQRLEYLLVLLKDVGPQNLINSVEAELKQLLSKY